MIQSGCPCNDGWHLCVCMCACVYMRVSVYACVNSTIFISHTEAAGDQEEVWKETLADDAATEMESRRGRYNTIRINPRKMHEIQVSRLVSKSRQLLGNTMTNLAESWMYIICKFDGGK